MNMALLPQDLRRRMLRFAVLCCCMGLGLSSVAAAFARPQVAGVTFDRRADGLGYVIRFHTTGPVSGYTEPRLAGEQLDVELFNVDLARAYARARPDGPVLAYSETAAGGHLRFQFRLDPAHPVEAEIYRDRLSTDILVGLTYVNELSSALPVPVRTAAATEPSVDTAASTVRDEGARWRLDTIVIDAGHGGKDGGATAHGVREKDVVLEVARRVGEYIEKNLGIRVVYTRKDDRFIELRDRGRIANANGAKLFVSIHANSAANQRAHGTETYFLGMHKTETARTVMERENEVIKLESDPGQYADLTERALIRQTLLQSANMRKSEELAGLVEHQFSDRARRTSRGVKQAGFIVLWGASMPAVLVELGFISNPEEARYLASESGQAHMASAIYRAIAAYKENYEKGLLVHSSQE